jgi:hypothetical protein
MKVVVLHVKERSKTGIACVDIHSGLQIHSIYMPTILSLYLSGRNFRYVISLADSREVRGRTAGTTLTPCYRYRGIGPH